MSCVRLTELERAVLAAIDSRQLSGSELIDELGEDATEVIQRFRAWGWVIAGSLELTGAGSYHGGRHVGGILPKH